MTELSHPVGYCKRLAKILLTEVQSGKPEACKRVRGVYLDAREQSESELARNFGNMRAQHVIAKELGFQNWTALKKASDERLRGAIERGAARLPPKEQTRHRDVFTIQQLWGAVEELRRLDVSDATTQIATPVDSITRYPVKGPVVTVLPVEPEQIIWSAQDSFWVVGLELDLVESEFPGIELRSWLHEQATGMNVEIDVRSIEGRRVDVIVRTERKEPPLSGAHERDPHPDIDPVEDFDPAWEDPAAHTRDLLGGAVQLALEQSAFAAMKNSAIDAVKNSGVGTALDASKYIDPGKAVIQASKAVDLSTSAANSVTSAADKLVPRSAREIARIQKMFSPPSSMQTLLNLERRFKGL